MGSEAPDPGVPPRALDLIKATVRAQPAYALAARDARHKLNQNESPYDLPDSLKREIVERVARARWPRYPEFVPARLLEQLAAWLEWPATGILVGNGSNELIQATLAVTIGPGDVVVAPAPTFSLYRLLTAVQGGRYVAVPLGPGFAYDVDALIDTASREHAKVIILNSPNNPTGSALPAGAVEQVLAATDALVLCDEAYQDFGGPTALPVMARSDRVVVLRTFSKALGMAGLRFGVGLAQPAIATEIAKAKLPYNVNLFTLTAAEVALAHMDVRQELVGRIVATRDRALARLRTVPGMTVYPSEGNFFLVRLHDANPTQVFERLLTEHDILVRNVSSVPGLEQCLRISVGTDEDMDAVESALRAILVA